MSLKKFGIILFLIFSLLPVQKIFAQNANTGFVPANIWYSKDPFEEGDKIKIYTLIFNPDTRQLSGTVNFFDNTVLLGKKDFTVAANATNAVSVSWTVTAGDHSIFGEIENAKFLVSAGNYQAVSLTENQTQKSSRTVSKKIVPGTTDANSVSQIGNNISSLVSDVKSIAEKTPSSITEPITSAVNTLEEFRTNTNIASDNKQGEIKNEIKALDNAKTPANSTTAPSSLLKPFKYVELFFFSVASFILNNKVLFYGIIILAVFFILRFIWNIVF